MKYIVLDARGDEVVVHLLATFMIHALQPVAYIEAIRLCQACSSACQVPES